MSSESVPIFSSPAIILVNPQLGENIGAAARAMANFGLSDLRLVAPRDGWPNDKALQMASFAQEILHRAKLFDTTKEAIADLQLVYGTSARDRRMVKPMISPRDALVTIHAEATKEIRSGILFGAERTGLTNEDIVLCDSMIVIPTTPEYASLNIAQSIVVIAYEWFVMQDAKIKQRPKYQRPSRKGSTGPNASPVVQTITPATQHEIDGFFTQLESELDRGDFWKNADKKPVMWQNLRNIFTRSRLTEQEVRTLRGIVRFLVQGH